MADASSLNLLYTASSVFGVGVIIIDFLGLLGHHDDSGTHDATLDHGGVDHPADGHEVGDHGAADHGTVDHGDVSGQAGTVVHAGDAGGDHGDASVHDDGGATHAAGDHHDATDHDQGDHPVHESPDTRGLLVLSVLRHLRSLVYFCVGFGPIGLLALWKGYGPPASLLWSVPVGIGAVFVARRILRFQTKDVDSTILPKDIILSKATVLVPLSKGSMGKVQIEVGIGVSEQYALPKHDDESFEKGDTVYVAGVSDECVYVESENRFLQSDSQ